VLDHFSDPEGGGFFFTSDDHETLIHRSKSFSDDATPAGNGVAAYILQRMGFLLGETRYLEAAEKTLRASWAVLEKYPHAHITLLTALDEYLKPPESIILRGDREQIEQWRGELAKVYAPGRMVLAIPAEEAQLPAALRDKAPHGPVVAYLCKGTVCSAPIEALGELIRKLRSGVH